MVKILESLKKKLQETKHGERLINLRTNNFIKYTPDRTQVKENFPILHPLYEVLPKDSFVPENATIPIYSENEILNAFIEADMWEEMPRFLFAGSREKLYFEPDKLKVGVLTAGGNAPGLDVLVDSLVKQQFLLGTRYHNIKNSIKLGKNEYPPNLKFYGIMGGFQGLLELENENNKPSWVKELNPRITDPWATRGCSSLHTLRTTSFEVNHENVEKRNEAIKDFGIFIKKLVANIRKLDLDILYTVGGNGTLKITDIIAEELQKDGGKPCTLVSGPKTMDNDINFTDVTFGFRTTVDNATKIIRDIHREAETLERIGIVELFGADSGFVALHSGYASGEADYVLIPETMGNDFNGICLEMEKTIKQLKKRVEDKHHALLIVAEGATGRAKAYIKNNPDFVKSFEHGDEDEKAQNFAALAEHIKKICKTKVFSNQPRHLIRATPPNCFDTDLCKYTGKLMVDTALAGYTRCSVQLWQNNYVIVPLETAIAELKKVDTTEYYFTSMREKYLLND